MVEGEGAELAEGLARAGAAGSVERARCRGRSARVRPTGAMVSVVVAIAVMGAMVGVSRAPAASAAIVAPTTTVLTSSSPASAVGQSVTLTATVRAGTTAPAGTVTFSDGTTVLGSATLFFSKYTLVVSTLTVGVHQITAAYGGTTGVAPSSASLTQTVARGGTTVTVTASANPSRPGQSVDLIATVAVVAPSTGTPAGSVVFTEGGITLGTVGRFFNKYTLRVPALAAGLHQITASFTGTATYSPSSASFGQIVELPRPVVSVSTSAPVAAAGQPIVLDATVVATNLPAPAPTGTVTFVEGATVLGAAPLVGGHGSISLATLSVGSHLVSVSYSGDANLQGATTAITQEIARSEVTVSARASEDRSTAGRPPTITATVAAAAPGNVVPVGSVTFSEGSTSLGTGLVDERGMAALALPPLPVGVHELTVAYIGDDRLAAGSTRLTITVQRARAALAVTTSSSPAVFGQRVSWTAVATSPVTSLGSPSGPVTFRLGDRVLATVTLVDGVGTISAPDLPVGRHDIAIDYGGDETFESQTVGGEQIVERARSSIAASSTADPSLLGTPASLALAVGATAPGAGTATGRITVSEGPVLLVEGTLDGGAVTVTLPDLAIGDHRLSLAYEGDGSFVGADLELTQSVVGAASAVSITPADLRFGEAGSALILVEPVGARDGAPVPSGTVTVFSGDTTLGSARLDGGSATVLLAGLSAGDHLLVATYAGDAAYAGSASTVVQHVGRAPSTVSVSPSASPARWGEQTVLAIETTGAGAPSGPLFVEVDGSVVAMALVDAGGRAEVALPILGIGPHALRVTYAGDDSFEPSAVDLEHRVDRASSRLSLTSSSNPTTPGDPATLTATVVGFGVPTGSLRATVDGIDVATVELDGTAAASLVLPELDLGVHTVAVSYLGGDSWEGTTATIEQTVARASIITVEPMERVVVGTAATAVVRVAPAGDDGVPAGRVAVLDDGAEIAWSTLDGGVAWLPLVGLPVGEHVLSVRYAGDEVFAGSRVALTVTVVRAAATVNLPAAQPVSTYGATVLLPVQMTGGGASGVTPGGRVRVMAGDRALGAAELDEAGRSTVAVEGLDVGDHTLTVVYDGDSSFEPTTAPWAQVVERSPAHLTMVSSAQSAVWGEAVMLRVEVPVAGAGAAVATGTVTFSTAGSSLGAVALDAGRATFALPPGDVGVVTITATYEGDGSYLPGTTDLDQDVRPATVLLVLPAVEGASELGAPSSLPVQVTVVAPGRGVVSGTITVAEGDAEVARVPVDGSATTTIDLPALSVGSHQLVISFAGHGFVSSPATYVHTVLAARTETSMSSDANPALVGGPVVLSTTVRAVAPAAGVPAGEVRFSEGATDLGRRALVEGSATLAISTLAVGRHEITVTFAANASFVGSAVTITQVIDKAPASIALVPAANPVVFGKPASLTARVSTGPTQPTPTGAVVFLDGASNLGAVTVVDGVATIALGTGLSIGTHDLTARYAGDATTLAATAVTVLVVNPIPTSLSVSSTVQPSQFGQAATIVATPTTTTGAAPTGSVVFRESGVTLATVTLFLGKYAMSTANLSAGTHTIVATYSAGPTYQVSTATIVQVVNRATTALSVVSTASPAVATSAAALQATLAVVAPGGGAVAGGVSFFEGATLLGSSSTPFFGKYSLPLGSLALGTHLIRVEFAGTANHAPSATTVSQTIVPAATAVTVSTPANPSPVLSTGTIAAVVASVAPATGAPTGSVTFSEGGVVLASPGIFFGQYGMSVSGLSVGSHVITVTFIGSGSYQGSSASITQEVVRAAPKVTVMSTSNPSVARDGNYLTVGVSSAAGSTLAMHGTVSFSDNGRPIRDVTVDGGKASLSFFDLSSGSHVITASFSGNELFLPATVPAFTQSIAEAPVTSNTTTSCTSAVGIGDSRLMNVSLYGRTARIATGTNSPLGNGAILAQPPRLQAIQGYRYGTFGQAEFVKAQKSRCAEGLVYFTVLGPNHLLSPTFIDGDTSAWDAVDTAEMYAMFDLMSRTDAYGPAGRIVAASFIYGPTAPLAARQSAAAHDRAVQDYIAAHPDRQVRLLTLDASAIAWNGADWVHPTAPRSSSDLPTGQDVLAQQVLLGLARLEPSLAAPTP